MLQYRVSPENLIILNLIESQSCYAFAGNVPLLKRTPPMNPFTELLDWLWLHAPGLLVLILILGSGIWLAIKINNFSHRLATTEQLCTDINDRQKEMSSEMNARFSEMNARFSKIELSLN